MNSSRVMFMLLSTAIILVQSTHGKTINVCAVPEPGYWEAQQQLVPSSGYSGSYDAKHLHDSIEKFGSDPPPSFIGIHPGETWPLSGFYANILPNVMFRAGISDYKIHFWNSYNRALYETTKTKFCDVGYTPFTATPARAFCDRLPRGTIPGCTDPLPGMVPEPKHACCASFGTAAQSVTLALMVTAKPPAANPISAIFNYSVMNIVALMTLAIIFAAHLVWYMEREENPQQFPPMYLDGIDDAIWWSCVTVTTVGYGDKSPITNIGRLFALVWMFTGVAFLGLFAGTIAGSVEKAARDLSINNIRDLLAADNVCTPSTMYADRYLASYKKFQYYVSEDETLTRCLKDLLNGTATAVFYEAPVLKNLFVANPNLVDLGYKVVEGQKQEFLGPVFPYEAANVAQESSESGKTNFTLKHTLNYALLEYMDTTEFRDEVERYFPETTEQSVQTEDNIDWLYVGPVCSYIIIYWLCCGVDKYRDGEFNSLICCRVFPTCKRRRQHDDETNDAINSKNPQLSNVAMKSQYGDSTGPASSQNVHATSKEHCAVETAAATTSETREIEEHLDMEASAQSTSIALSLDSSSWGARQKKLLLRNSMFVARGVQLRKDIASNANHHAGGHNRMLFADGPEFVGLSSEVHALHRLLLSQTASMMTMVRSMNSLCHQSNEKVGGGVVHVHDHDTDEEENQFDQDLLSTPESRRSTGSGVRGGEEEVEEEVEVEVEEEREFTLPSSGPAKISISLADLSN